MKKDILSMQNMKNVPEEFQARLQDLITKSDLITCLLDVCMGGNALLVQYKNKVKIMIVIKSKSATRKEPEFRRSIYVRMFNIPSVRSLISCCYNCTCFNFHPRLFL